jgi:hypothetical protein
MVGNKLNKFAFTFSLLALLLSILTFLKTGGMNDIKEQVKLLREDIQRFESQTDLRMENRSLIFDALCDLTASLDSLKAGKESEAKALIEKGIEKIRGVEKKVTKNKKKQLEDIRGAIEKLHKQISPGDVETISKLEYQLILLRIFEENL